MKMPRIQFTLDASVRAPFLMSYLLAAITCFLTVGFYLQLPPELPLFYTLAEPSAQLVQKSWLFLLPTFAITWSILHTLIVQTLHHRGQVVAKLFAWSTVVMQLLLSLVIFRTIMIIT